MSQIAKDLIVNVLKDGSWRAIHEFPELKCIPGCGENSIGSRLPELALAGQVISKWRCNPDTKTKIKEWHIAINPTILPAEVPCVQLEKVDAGANGYSLVCAYYAGPCRSPLAKKFCKMYKAAV